MDVQRTKSACRLALMVVMVFLVLLYPSIPSAQSSASVEMRDTSYVDDFDTVLTWVERDGIRYLSADLTPHPETAVGYTRLNSIMTEDDWIPIRADFYDGEELARTVEFSDFRTIQGRVIPMVFQVIPHDKAGESTRVEYIEHEIDLDVSDGLFTPRGLRRTAQR